MVLGKALAAGLLGIADRQQDDVGILRHLDRLGDQLAVLRRIGQEHLVHRPVLALGDEDALRMDDLRLAGQLRAHPVQQRHRLARNGRIAAQPRDRGIGSDDRDAPARPGGQRQSPVILQQRDRSMRGLQRQRACLPIAGQRVPVPPRPGIFEQARAELERQHPGAGDVDRLGRHLARPHLIDQRAIGDAVGQLAIHPGAQRGARRRFQVGLDMVDGVEFGNRAIVAHHRAVEMPFAAQNVAQQPYILMARYPVYLIIAGHDGGDAGALHHRAEGREEILAQFALADRRGRDILAALRLAMPGHVLERRHHLVGADLPALALQAQHRRDAHFAAQIGILAERLLDPAPARIAGDVHHRRQRQMHAPRPHLAGDHRLHLAHQRAVETAGHADRHREHGRVGRHIAVQRLLVKQHRNAEPRLLHRPCLHRFDEGDRVPGRAPARADPARLRRSIGRAAPIRRPRNLAETLRIGRARLRGREGQVVHDLRLGRP